MGSFPLNGYSRTRVLFDSFEILLIQTIILFARLYAFRIWFRFATHWCSTAKRKQTPILYGDFLFFVVGTSGYDTVRPVAYPETHVFILCFTISDPTTLESIITKVSTTECMLERYTFRVVRKYCEMTFSNFWFSLKGNARGDNENLIKNKKLAENVQFRLLVWWTSWFIDFGPYIAFLTSTNRPSCERSLFPDRWLGSRITCDIISCYFKKI